MSDPLNLHPPTALLTALCKTITESIHPLSEKALAKHPGTKLFGAAILLKSDLSLVYADTNQEGFSPIWHGETYCIAQFFELDPATRPKPKDCIFLSTHEPCSLCINAIVWSGFDNFVYMWPYEETDTLFGIDGDLIVYEKCFYDDGKTATEGGARHASFDGKVKVRRPQYRAVNDMFVARSFNEVVAAVEDEREREGMVTLLEDTKKSYGALDGTFRERTGVKAE